MSEELKQACQVIEMALNQAVKSGAFNNMSESLATSMAWQKIVTELSKPPVDVKK